MREEAAHAKQRQRAAEDKLRQLAAQLARTEEAAKRILVRTDPSARGGTAQRLLDAERELAGSRAELAELGSQLARARRQAADRKAQTAELKSRLDATLSAQRHLALQLGRLQASGSASRSSRAMPALPANPLSQQADHNGSIRAGAQDSEPAQGEAQPVGGSGEVEAAAARRFTIQQEQLAAAQERGRRLGAQLRQQRELVQGQEGELGRLRAQLGSTAGPRQAEATPLARQEVVSSRPCSQRSPLAGSQLQGGGVGEGSSAWLRLKWLESRASLERCTASNGRLLRELEGARQQVQALQQEMSWREEQLEEAWEQSRQQDPHHGLQALGRLGPTVVRQAQEAGRTGWPLEACPANGSHLDPNTREQGILSAQSAGLPAAPAAAVLQLKQKLAEANYRASRLRIELDAAEAKLAAIQGSSGGQGRQHTSHSLQQQQLQHGAPSTQTQAHAVPRPILVELHLHAVEVHESSPALQLARAGGRSAGPLFMTADLPGFATATTPVMKGAGRALS
ncbi:hypothetical protein ABPG77_008327 [Micractinium sp. CCAP 211/92]